MIERFGGVPHVSPSMREVSVGENPEAVDFAREIIAGQIDVVIFMTGVGVRHLLAEVEGHVDRQQFLDRPWGGRSAWPAAPSRWPCSRSWA